MSKICTNPSKSYVEKIGVGIGRIQFEKVKNLILYFLVFHYYHLCFSSSQLKRENSAKGTKRKFRLFVLFAGLDGSSVLIKSRVGRQKATKKYSRSRFSHRALKLNVFCCFLDKVWFFSLHFSVSFKDSFPKNMFLRVFFLGECEKSEKFFFFRFCFV